MSTGQRQTPHGQHRETVQTTALDSAIEVTEKQKSLAMSAANVLGVPVNQLLDLLRNVWKTSIGKDPLTPQEMFVGISMIARYELDPIAREVYVTRGKGGVFTIISIDGWVKVLDRTDHYDGFDIEIHEEKPGVFDWVEVSIHSKKRTHPTRYRAYASEYARIGGMVAKQIPTHMLRIFALRHAARLFTPIGGAVLTEEEAVFIARNADQMPSQNQTTADITAELAKPIAPTEELPDSSYEPEQTVQPTADNWESAMKALAAADSIRDVDTIEGHWSPLVADGADFRKLCEAKRGDIRGSRGERSNKQRELVQ